MFDEHPSLSKFVDQASRLYSPPVVALEILQLTSQPKVDLSALKQCLQRDPALVGKILRVVNSSIFGLSREVVDLGQALALLGTKSVRLLVLGFSLPDELFMDLAGDVLQRYWHHTLVKAAAAREISETFYRLPGEEPFIAGLLQDIGVLVLLQQLGEPYVRFLGRAFAKDVDVDAAEAIALGFEHEQLSARLLERWGLPESLVNAIGTGHCEERIGKLPAHQRALPQILHMADLVAGMLTESRASSLAELQRLGRQYRQLTIAQLSSLVAVLQTKVGQLADALSLELPEGVDYQSIVTDAHRQLSLAAEEAALEIGQTTSSEDSSVQEAEGNILAATSDLSEAAQRFLNVPAMQRDKKTIPRVNKPTYGVSSNMGSSVAAGRTAVLSSITAETAAELSLGTQVEMAVAASRQVREPLSLLLVELDRYRALQARSGEAETRRLVQLVGLMCSRIEHGGLVQLQTAPSGFALVLPNCDRRAAGDIGHYLLREVRRLCDQHADLADGRLSVSVGVATSAMPAKNFSSGLLIDSARRCLHAAQLSSGNAIKTIDVL